MGFQIPPITGNPTWDTVISVFVPFLGGIIGGIIAGSLSLWTSRQDRRNQIRIAALDKRLDAHQQAYTHWRKMMSISGNSEGDAFIMFECQEWWNNNCLYLTPEARQAFQKAYSRASIRSDLIATHADNKLLEENRRAIAQAGPIIVRGVLLTDLGEKEIEPKTK